MVNPSPHIWVGNRIYPYEQTTDPQGRRVARSGLNATAATMLGEMSIEWGRADVWTQPEPSVMTVTLWQSDKWIERNPTDNYLIKSANGSLIGERLVGYFPSGVVPSPRAANGFAGASWRFFEGRISNVDLKRLDDVPTENGLENGWLVRVQGSDQVAAVAQIPPLASLPHNQTMITRANSIATAIVGADVGEVYFESTYTGGRVKGIDTADKSSLDLVDEMYASFSHQYAYNPHRHCIIRIPAAYNHGAYSLLLGRRSAGDTIRLYPPRQVDNSGRNRPDDSDPYPSGYIGGCDVQGEVVLSVDSTHRVRTIRCRWFNDPNGDGVGTDTISAIAAQTTTSPNTLEFESWFIDGLQIDPIMLDVKAKILAEGSRPFHPAITWDTARSGDVPDWETFMSLTLPMQSVRMVVVAGSPFAAHMQVAPVWYPAGGTIVYGDGRWKFTTNLAPAPLTLSGTPITFTNVQTANPGVTLGELDHSIGSWDMRYVTNTTIQTYN